MLVRHMQFLVVAVVLMVMSMVVTMLLVMLSTKIAVLLPLLLLTISAALDVMFVIVGGTAPCQVIGAPNTGPSGMSVVGGFGAGSVSGRCAVTYRYANCCREPHVGSPAASQIMTASVFPVSISWILAFI